MKSGYQPPAQQEIIKAVTTELDVEYTNNDNDERNDQKKLLKDVAANSGDDAESHLVMQGALWFVRERIAETYRLVPASFPSDPTGMSSLFSSIASWSPVYLPNDPNRSGLYRFTNKILLLNKPHTMDSTGPDANPTKFICLSAFLNHVENQNKSLVPHAMREQIQRITRTALKSLTERIQAMCVKESAMKSRQENVRTLSMRYDNLRAQDYLPPDSVLSCRSQDRIDFLHFLEQFDDCLKVMNVPEKDRDFIINGAAVKKMADIENEYKYSLFLAPEGSDLYKILQKKTGFYRSSQFIGYAQTWLAAFYKAICEMTTSEDASVLEFWKKQNVDMAALEKIKTDILLLQNELIQVNNGINTGHRNADIFINKIFNSLAEYIANIGMFSCGTLTAASVGVDVSTLFAAASAYPQLAVTMMSVLWAANYLRAPINKTIASYLAPILKPVLVTPVNAMISCMVTRPTLFYPEQKISSDESAENNRLLVALLTVSDEIYPRKKKEELAALFNVQFVEPSQDPSHSTSMKQSV